MAAGAGVLVLVEPPAHLFPTEGPPGETVVRIAPGAETIGVFGSDLGGLPYPRLVACLPGGGT
ncbi:hypothetical protein AB0D67_37000, partial [Streptosporangium sp. NPDC048047]|uniref:hypothetical protein n=1 Tax=Streptosporangium sp. NPDC048047 TaxID=3155748 RepID=UPI0034323A97